MMVSSNIEQRPHVSHSRESMALMAGAATHVAYIMGDTLETVVKVYKVASEN